MLPIYPNGHGLVTNLFFDPLLSYEPDLCFLALMTLADTMPNERADYSLGMDDLMRSVIHVAGERMALHGLFVAPSPHSVTR